MPPSSNTTTEKPWHHHLTIDLILLVANRTILHPFVAWMIPLCLRSQASPWTALSMRISIAYASLLTLLFFLSKLNQRVAYGKPRTVDLSEEVIVITGGASGLGLLIAEVYGMRGASVAVLDVREMENGQAEAEERGVLWYRCDVGNRKQVEAVRKQIEKDLGTPTILINNAGIVNGKSILQLSPEDIERYPASLVHYLPPPPSSDPTLNMTNCQNFRVNLLSHYHTIQTFLPGMLRAPNGGTIVTVSSVLGHLGCANLSDYTASKSALHALHSSLLAELSPTSPSLSSNPDNPNPSPISLLLISPGQLSTPLFAGVRTPSSFLGPVLSAADVAKEVIGAIDGGQSGELAMPLYARWVPGILGILPVGVRATLRWGSGWDSAMGGFVGREGISGGRGEGGKGE
ncbi:MAG: hypothetical protein M1827_005298 [Pycnora praestabilis]|nr:MAG: hypothetical protein M1827_005298 [Pycnora praestabilis]